MVEAIAFDEFDGATGGELYLKGEAAITLEVTIPRKPNTLYED